jgi:TRAP-type C4-dicarboxylate transport system permease large subunit
MAAMLMGAIAGSAMASASAMGSILGPEMEKKGYSKEFGAAVNITSATTGLVIPPSNVLIVYSLASGGVSIAALVFGRLFTRNIDRVIFDDSCCYMG